MTVSPASAPSSASAASKYARLGFPTSSASTPAAYSSPVTKAPASRSGPADVCHQRFLCRQTRRAPSRSAAKARFRFVHAKTRPVSSLSSAPPRRTASGRSSTSSTWPSRSGRIELMVSARTRDPASAFAAASGVVSISPSSSSKPIALSSSARVARARVVLFVTKRRRCPDSRSAATASGAPSIGFPETWRTPSMSRRMPATGASLRPGGRGTARRLSRAEPTV